MWQSNQKRKREYKYNNKNDKAMKIYNEITLSNRNFEFWGSAKENAESLTNGQLDTVESILEDLYPEGISATQLNDIFRFDFDQIQEWLGIEPEE